MDCDFLMFVLNRMVFSDRWIGWMRRCVTCACVLVLVNGFVGLEFLVEKGLKQSCQLLPMLFNLLVEALPILVNQFEYKQWLNDVSIQEVQDRTSIL